jgi:hypothetical protein
LLHIKSLSNCHATFHTYFCCWILSSTLGSRHVHNMVQFYCSTTTWLPRVSMTSNLKIHSRPTVLCRLVSRDPCLKLPIVWNATTATFTIRSLHTTAQLGTWISANQPAKHCTTYQSIEYSYGFCVSSDKQPVLLTAAHTLSQGK